jgi:uncharacterized protein (DUF924 family)
MADAHQVLAFWLEPKPTTAAETDARRHVWFNGGDAVDRDVRERFGGLVEQARRGELEGWPETPRGTLALILLLDQFPRNLHRDSPEAFSSDGSALALAREGFDSGRFAELDALDRSFAALPFQHAEDLSCQKRAVSLAQQAALVAKPEWKSFLVECVDYARRHLDVIARFGRFPHRNRALGRVTTGAEQEYLDFLESAGQWL